MGVKTPEPALIAQLDLVALARALRTLGTVGVLSEPAEPIRTLLVGTGVVEERKEKRNNVFSTALVATSHLFALGSARLTTGAIHRVTSLLSGYREHMLNSIHAGLRSLPDDRALADTLERLDHLSPELLMRLDVTDDPSPYLPPQRGEGTKETSLQRGGGIEKNRFAKWDAEIWQAPDAVTLLAKVVENPADFPERPGGPKVAVGFDWLSWNTPPATPAPAPWDDHEPLRSPLTTARHPFWGALVATLDACTGDYEWQSLMLRNGVLRSHHRTLGSAEAVLKELWSRELGLYPAAPLVLPEDITFIPGKPIPWLQPALEHMVEDGVATQAEGSWRLTDAFRTQLMKDDEHMLAFEAVRKRSYRLAQAAERAVEHPLTLAPLPEGGKGA